VLLFIGSWLLRQPDPSYAPSLLPFAPELAAAGMALVTAWLGGELVYRLRVGVDDDDADLNASSSLDREGLVSTDGSPVGSTGPSEPR
jgi:uncharacterized membrane protein